MPSKRFALLLAYLGLLTLAMPGLAVEVEERISSVSIEVAVDTSRHDREKESDRMLVTLDSEWFLTTDSGISLVVGGRFKLDMQDNFGLNNQRFNDYYSSVSKPLELSEHASVELRNFYFEYEPDSCLMNSDSCAWRVGKQQIVWGQADGIKILDVVNPQSFESFILDDFNNSRTPLWTVNYEIGHGGNDFQFLWIMDPTSHFIAESERAYGVTSPQLVPDMDRYMAIHGGAEAVKVDYYDARQINLKNSELGFRFATFRKGWDISLNYLFKLSDLPTQTIRRRQIDGIDTLHVTFEDRRNHVLGGTLSNSFGNLTVRGEMAYISNRTWASDISPEAITHGDELAYVIGLDWYGFGDAMVSMQYNSSHQLNRDIASNRDRVDDIITLLYKQSFINDSLTAKVIFEHSVNIGDGLGRYSLAYGLSDETKIMAEFNQFYGSGEGIFGQYGHNDHFRLLFKYTF